MALARSTASITVSNATTAFLREWTQAIHAILLAAGWTQTADTGQADLTTIVTSATHTPLTIFGYKVYKSPDEVGLSNLYMKLEFANRLGTAAPNVRVTIGWATDGAGAIVNQLTSPLDNRFPATELGNLANQVSASNMPLRADAGEFLFWFPNATNGSSAMFLSIERCRDRDLLPMDRFHVLYSDGSGAAPYHRTVDKLLGQGPILTLSNDAHIAAGSQANSMLGTSIGTGFLFPLLGSFHNPIRNVISCWPGILGTAMNIIPIEVFGAETDYLVAISGNASYIPPSAAAAQPLIRWE